MGKTITSLGSGCLLACGSVLRAVLRNAGPWSQSRCSWGISRLGNDIKAMSAAKWMSFLVFASFFDRGWKYINGAMSKSSRKPELKELLGNVGVNIFGKRPRGKGACWNLYTACELWVGWRPGLSKQKIFPQVTQSCHSNVLLFPVLFPG